MDDEDVDDYGASVDDDMMGLLTSATIIKVMKMSMIGPPEERREDVRSENTYGTLRAFPIRLIMTMSGGYYSTR